MDNVNNVAEHLLVAAIIFIVVALICNLVVVTGRSKAAPAQVKTKEKVRAKKPAAVSADGTATKTVSGTVSGTTAETTVTRGGKSTTTTVRTTGAGGLSRGRGLPTGLAFYATGFTFTAFLLTLVYLIIRSIQTGYGPFSNQHEFAISFVCGILAAYLVAEYLYQIRIISLFVLPVAAVLLLYALALDTSVRPLIPALQNNLLLTLHVGFAMLAYGAACVSCGAAILYLLYPYLKFRRMPPRDLFDDIGYKAATVTFPLLTIMILLGAVWANTAWGRYWGWDPKETAALVTWLIYGAYLHARVTRGWQGKRSAWLLLLGFAAVLFAYFGNHFFGGLHCYA